MLISLGISAAPPPEWSTGGMVSADHALASAAGAEVLQRGGNAVDAAIASALAAGVVQPAGSGLGGGGFAVVQNKEGPAQVLDFRERAPQATHRDIFAEHNNPKASQIGGLAVAIPGEAQGLAELHASHGRLPLKQVVAPAWRLAAKGFVVGYKLDQALSQLTPKTILSMEHLFGQANRPNRGDQVRRKALAASLKAFSKHGADDFTEGWIAKDIVASVRSTGGLMSLEDCGLNPPRYRKPLTGSYKGWTVTTMPAPSSGGVVILQALQVLENVDLASLGHNSSALLHRYAETFQHAFADRARYMGDPERTEIPVERLLSSQRTQEILAAFMSDQTLESDAYGMPLELGSDGGTQHISVIDVQGNMVALTSTINTSFGSKVVTEHSGLVLNNEMDDFVARPGVPNAYGLVGSEANSVSPLAIPLSSMSPTILTSPRGEKIAVGASGGPFIISATLQSIVNIIDFGMTASEAVSAPRVHHQWTPRALFVDKDIPLDVRQSLESKGHSLRSMPFHSSVQMVYLDGSGQFHGASDPRKGGRPAGVMR